MRTRCHTWKDPMPLSSPLEISGCQTLTESKLVGPTLSSGGSIWSLIFCNILKRFSVHGQVSKVYREYLGLTCLCIHAFLYYCAHHSKYIFMHGYRHKQVDMIHYSTPQRTMAISLVKWILKYEESDQQPLLFPN